MLSHHFFMLCLCYLVWNHGPSVNAIVEKIGGFPWEEVICMHVPTWGGEYFLPFLKVGLLYSNKGARESWEKAFTTLPTDFNHPPHPSLLPLHKHHLPLLIGSTPFLRPCPRDTKNRNPFPYVQHEFLLLFSHINRIYIYYFWFTIVSVVQVLYSNKHEWYIISLITV